MKDNLDVFEVLFCPVGEQQRPTHIHACAHTHKYLMLYFACRTSTPAPAPPNPDLTQPHPKRDYAPHHYISNMFTVLPYAYIQCKNIYTQTYTSTRGGIKSNSLGRNDQKAADPTGFQQDETMIFKNKPCFVLFSTVNVYIFRPIPEHRTAGVEIPFIIQLFVDPFITLCCRNVKEN